MGDAVPMTRISDCHEKGKAKFIVAFSARLNMAAVLEALIQAGAEHQQGMAPMSHVERVVYTQLQELDGLMKYVLSEPPAEKGRRMELAVRRQASFERWSQRQPYMSRQLYSWDPIELDQRYSGTTCVSVLVDQVQRLLHVANVGDSRAVLGREIPDAKTPRFQAIALTQDQKPDDEEELDRIRMSGGHVQRALDEEGNEVGPARVWDGPNCMKPGLGMSRTLGDGCARECGVIADPVVAASDSHASGSLHLDRHRRPVGFSSERGGYPHLLEVSPFA
ncbi:unnamed protein product [Prorocentrum cordatum]|uniref:PPM-type phosphatase domain-containing protein n=1 Tax=Prorocentrum cordatum TaxID=2364126 RepID=A0ABN9T0L9_9DINO|nr:unnamed protein product [Polarella glacialis]